MNEPAVLIVGAADDLACGLESAARRASGSLATVDSVADLSSAAVRLAEPECNVQLVVLCESRPGVYSVETIDALRRAAPLVRFWRLLGSWCEGEQRSDRPPAGCASAYWHQWPARATIELTAARAGRCPTWGLPLTATADERTLAAATRPREQHAGLIVVSAASAETSGALADACRLGGYQTQIVHDLAAQSTDPEPPIVNAATALLWDTPIERAGDARLVADLRRMSGGAPVLAVAGFPRPEETRRALRAGVESVISKPYLVADLLWHLAHAARCRD